MPKLFDFNRDGKMDIFERAAEFQFLDEVVFKDRSTYEYDDYDSDIDDSDEDSEDLFDPYGEGDEYGIYAEDFDSLDEYYEAVEDARFEETGNYFVPNTTVSVEISNPISSDTIEEKKYDNIRQEEAARELERINKGTAYIPSYSTKEIEKEKYQFILEGKCIAAKYLTCGGDFLLAQAIKENFDVPVRIKDEDRHIKTTLCDLLLEIAEEDSHLAVDIWKWCLEEFGPYRKFNIKPFWLYNSVLYSSEKYHPDFTDIAIREFSDEWFCKEVFENNPEFPSSPYRFISRALAIGEIDRAVDIFSASLSNIEATSQNKEIMVKCIIDKARNWNEKETMELVIEHLFPVLKNDSNKRMQRLYPEYLAETQKYITSMEESKEYRYKGKYEWRNKYKDRTDYNVLQYKTEEEYLKVAYSWRNRYIPTAEHFGIDITKCETEEEFELVLRGEIDKEKQRKLEQTAKVNKQASGEHLAKSDKTVYTFCGVMFESSDRIYHYLIKDLDVDIGDMVIVPVGIENRETMAEVMTIEKHRRKTAPFSVEKAKVVLRKA